MAEILIEMNQSRRAFLKKTGWIAGGLTVLSGCGGLLPPLPSSEMGDQEDAFLWLQMRADGSVRFLCPRMEMGQGVTRGLSRIVADELRLSMDQVVCQLPATDQLPPFRMTVGSEGIRNFAQPVRNAARKLHETLKQRAEALLVGKKIAFHPVPGGFKTDTGLQFAYRDLLTEREKEEAQGMLRETPTYSSNILRGIVTGQAIYARDVSKKEMLHAYLFRSPVPLEADQWMGLQEGLDERVQSWVMPEGDKLALVSEDLSLLLRSVAERELPNNLAEHRADDWVDPMAMLNLPEDDDFEHSLLTEGEDFTSQYEPHHKLTAVYKTSFQTHAAMEPRAAVADVRENRARIWCGSQDPYFVRRRVARLLGLAEEEVVVEPRRLGGGFGGRVWCQAAEEAAWLSQKAGKPVKVQWRREDEFQHNYLQPAFQNRLSAQLDQDGRLLEWRQGFVSAPIIFGLVPPSLSWAVDAFAADKGTARGAVSPYQSGRRQIDYSDIRLDILTGPWRGLGSAPLVFANETMMDELAHLAGQDAVHFRLRHLGQEQRRLAMMIRKVARMCRWGRKLPQGSGLGIAAANYKDETSVAIAAEVEIQDGEIVLKHIWCAQDSGQVIDEDGVRHQIEGNIAWGCGMALTEQVTFDGPFVRDGNFDDYEIPRHSLVPEISIDLANNPGERPVGVGEAALGPVAPAIGNAIFAATGRRLRNLPFNLDTDLTENAIDIGRIDIGRGHGRG